MIGDNAPHAETRSRQVISSWIYFWPLFLLLPSAIAVRAVDPDLYARVIDTESGMVETATVLILVPAVVLGVWIARAHQSGWPYGLRAFFILFTLGVVYFAGEEANWGQVWFGWDTPDFLRRINEQGETNLHNISSWLNYKPRLALRLAALFSGLYAFTLLLRNRGPRDWYWPGIEILPAVTLAWAVKLYDSYLKMTRDFPPEVFRLRFSEFEELFLASAITFYLWSAYLRLRDTRPAFTSMP